MEGLQTQIVRTIMQFVWAGLGAIGAEQVINSDQFELWITGIAAAVLLAVLSWLERKVPWIGKFFVYDKPPSY